MDRTLQFHSLFKDELHYEVKIRSETPSNTVDGLRKQLRKLLVECPPEAVIETDEQAESELNIVKNKLVELTTNVDQYVLTRDKYSANRSKALFNHVYNRLVRVQVDDDPVKIALKTDLRAKLDALQARFNSSIRTSSSVENISTLVNTQPSVSGNVQVICSGDKNISKWGVRFNGQTDPRSFLERVDELQLAYGVSDVTLYNSAAQLFVDQALLWFRGIREQVTSWKDLKDILLSEFSQIDYDYRLLGEIRARTQGLDEPTHIYFSVMACMFSRLQTPLSEEAKLEILLHNIRPGLSQQLALVNITSIADLKDNCRKLEAARLRADLFVEPAKPGSHTLSSDFAYKSKSKQVNSVSTGAEKHSAGNSSCCSHSAAPVQSFSSRNSKQSRTPSAHVRKPSKPQICYKCKKPNHNFRSCKEKPKQDEISCFDCGTPGVTRLNCHKCLEKRSDSSKSKN